MRYRYLVLLISLLGFLRTTAQTISADRIILKRKPIKELVTDMNTDSTSSDKIPSVSAVAQWIATHGGIGGGLVDTGSISNFYLKVRSLHTASLPIAYNSVTGSISITQASNSTNGYLSSVDWNTFNDKLSSVDTNNISNFYLKSRSLFTGTTPITYNNTTGAIGVTQASSSTGGYLTAADWTTFNNKLSSVDTSNISNFYSKVRSLFSGTSPITFNNGTIGITQASGSTNGYLSSADWNNFNAKAPSSGSSNYIQNQTLSPQPANAWLRDTLRVDGYLSVNSGGLIGPEKFRLSGDAVIQGNVNISSGKITVTNEDGVDNKIELLSTGGQGLTIVQGTMGNAILSNSAVPFGINLLGGLNAFSMFPTAHIVQFPWLGMQGGATAFGRPGRILPMGIDSSGQIGNHDFGYVTSDSLKSYGFKTQFPIAVLKAVEGSGQQDTLVAIPASDTSDGFITAGQFTNFTQAYNKYVNSASLNSGTGVLTFTRRDGTTFTATGFGTGSGSGDASTNTSSSVDGEIALFSGTGGKTIKRATGSGIVKITSGVLGTATSGTDYAPATSGSAILKGNGSGGFSSATAGTDYYNPGGTDVAVADGGTGASSFTANRLLIGNGTSAITTDANLTCDGTNVTIPSPFTTDFTKTKIVLKDTTNNKIYHTAYSPIDMASFANNNMVKYDLTNTKFVRAVSGTDYAPATSGSSILKGNGSGGFSNASAGTDYLAPFGSQTANYIYAAPNGSAGSPTFRALVAADVPTLNQNTTGSAATLTTSHNIYGNTFNGSADVTGTISGTYGGTGVNNGSKTITISGNVSIGSSTHTVSFTTSGNTTLALPTTGTAATLAGSESLTNKKLGSLTTNGFVKTSSGDGTLSVSSSVSISSDVSGLGTGIATFLGTPSSANIASAVTDETGTDKLVLSASPALTGTPTAPTAATGTNTTQIATTAFVQQEKLSYSGQFQSVTDNSASVNTGVTFVLYTNTVDPSGTTTITLPAASSNTGRVITIANRGVENILLAATSGNVYYIKGYVGSSTSQITQTLNRIDANGTTYGYATLVSDGTDWIYLYGANVNFGL